MGYVKYSTVALAVLFIAGCSSPEPPPPAKTVFDPLKAQVDRAREVQKTVDEGAEKTRKEIENQERGENHP
jgi:PBP1b-binding outer membrane lipoprotein LpoB